MQYDRVIKNGMVVDGTRQPRFLGDIGIKNGAIAMVGKIDGDDAKEVIDATGLIVAPGFIDLHTHYDAQLFWDPYCSLSGWHGVTSVVIGNCGLGFAPMQPENRDRALLSMTRIEAIPYKSMKCALPWDWVSFPEFLNSVERTNKAVNILAYVPIGPLLVWVLGMKDAKAGRKPTDAEHAELRRVLAEALDAGGCGWSAQYTPPGPMSFQRDYDGTPMATDLMHPETFCELAKVLRQRNEGFIELLHMTGDPDTDEAMFEKLAEVSGRPVLMNVVAAVDHMPGKHRRELAWLKRCRERGLRVIGQGFTTTAGYSFKLDEWNLWDNCDVWREAMTGTPAERKAIFSDPARRSAFRDYPPDGLFALNDLLVVEVKLEKNKPWQGLKLGEIAAKTGKDMVDIMLDLAVEEDLQTEFYGPQMNNSLEHFKEVVEDPWVMFGCSDGGAHTRFVTFGRWPTETIIKTARDNNIIPLEELHWRLSTLPAIVAGLRNRGTLAVGAAADIVVYDLKNLKVLDVETAHDFPANEWRRIQRASGYRYVLVNGEVTIRDDRQTDTYSGQLLRQGRAAERPALAAE